MPEYKLLNKLAIWENDIGEDKYEAQFFDILDKFLSSHLNNKIELLKQKERSGGILTSEETLELASLLLEQRQK